jgi:hypothetical protein
MILLGRCDHRVDAAARALNHHVADAVDVEQIVAANPDQCVRPC